MEFLTNNFPTVITALLFVIAAFGGVKATQVRGKLKRSVAEVIDVLRSIVTLLAIISEIGADNKMTEGEVAQLKEAGLAAKKEVDELREIWRKKPEVPDIPEVTE